MPVGRSRMIEQAGVNLEVWEAGSGQPLDEQNSRGLQAFLAAWWTVFLLFVLYTISFIDRFMVGLFVGPIKATFGITDFQFSLLQGIAFALFYALFGLPIGWLVDRYSKRMIMFVGLVVWSLAACATGLANGYWMMLLARVGVGAGEATLAPAGYSILPQLFARDKLALPMSIMGAGSTFGAGLGALLGGFLIAVVPVGGLTLGLFGHLQNWRLAMALMALPGLVLAPLVFTIKVPKAAKPVDVALLKAKASPKQAFAQIRRHRRFYTGHFLGFGCIAICGYGLALWLPATLMRRFDYSLPEAGAAIGGATLFGGLVGGVFMGLVADKWYSRGSKDAHLKLFALAILVQAGLIWAAMFASDIRVVIVALALQMALNQFPGIAGAALQLFTPAHIRGQVSVMYIFVFTIIGQGAGPSIVAFFTDFVFRNEADVNKSIALTYAIFAPLATFFLWLASRPMREHDHTTS